MSKSQQGCCPIQAELFVPFLSPPQSRFSSALLLVLSYLQAYVHAVRFLLELSLLALLLPFQRSGLRSLPLSSLSYWFSVTFKPATCVLFASFPSSASSSIHVRHSSGIMLSMHNKTAQPRMPIMFHLDRRTHMDKRSDELPLNEQMSGQTDTWTNGQMNFR